MILGTMNLTKPRGEYTVFVSVCVCLAYVKSQFFFGSKDYVWS